MNLKLTIFLILCLVLFGVNTIEGLKCYVCADDGELPCRNFTTTKDIYAKECNSSHQGCLRKVEGNKVTRSCVNQKFEDCKVANKVQYCFCWIDLCNGISGKFLSPPTDDEDFLEGSGIKLVSTTAENFNMTTKIISAGFKVYLSQIIFFVSLITILHK